MEIGTIPPKLESEIHTCIYPNFYGPDMDSIFLSIAETLAQVVIILFDSMTKNKC